MKMLMNGHDRESSDGKVIYVINPANQEVLDSVPAATKEDVEAMLDVANEAKHTWKKIPVYERAAILFRYTELLLEHRDEVANLVSQESGKTLASCYGEVDSSINVFRSYAEKARNFGGEVLPRDSEERITGDLICNFPEPLGVVVSIVPYNYPIELFAHKVAPALVAGNVVILKPASETPLGNLVMSKLLLEAGVHPGALQVVTGHGEDIGDWLSGSPKIDVISLTGSTRAGILISQQAAKNLTRVLLELGGNDPLIILDDADIDYAVSETLVGRASNAGQTCCGSKRFIVHNKIRKQYEEKLIAALSELKVGNPADADTHYGPLISERAAKGVEEQVALTVKQGGKVIYGGKRFDTTYFEPTVISGVTKEMDIAKDMEIFGPVFPVIGFDTVEEAIEIANQSCYGLSSGVITGTIDVGMKVANEIESGTCVIGGCGNYRSAHQPFGGYKKSGIGREGVTETLREYTQIKNVAFRRFGI